MQKANWTQSKYITTLKQLGIFAAAVILLLLIFDKIVMPLPHTGYRFLEEAFYCIKPKGKIYFYEIVERKSFKTSEWDL